MLWTETKTGEDCEKRHLAMWGSVVERTDDGLVSRPCGEGLYEGDEFWAASIARLKDDPLARLQMALRHLPLPAAFREAAIALRAMIRAKRKAKLPFEDELGQLHRLAAMASLAPYDTLEMTPATDFERIDLRPETIGWNEIVSFTDAKWMAEVWPEPAQHTTASMLYPEVAKASAARYNKMRAEMRQRIAQSFLDNFDEDEIDDTQPTSSEPAKPSPVTTKLSRRTGIFARLFRW
ncbi:hypothetical protein SAMN06297144_1888 [Sphingomonas guangdongensis]|uniref:Uncharacterized protein n=2 Tax=Sphingomonas guangdongensis TaxID=1141890 RepID=A0A285QZG0_9SPHN|nr:hypothetical protein SAMN06297144_1888 [Sphingomonas guangdongensis]